MTSRHLFAFLFCSVITLGCDKENISEGTVKDADGNIYHTIVVDSQLWMLENLKTTRYNDGTPILQITDNQTWNTLTVPAYCWHGNNPENKEPYGALYNWHAVKTGKLCPAGWHVPTFDDWMILNTYVRDDGGRLKEQGITHWTFPNSQASNVTGFTALPGSFRGFNGQFGELGVSAEWWSDGPYNGYDAVGIGLYHYDFSFGFYAKLKTFGFSVRCVRDEGAARR
jgi:uncharacterized protein (TIGR02145 family)